MPLLENVELQDEDFEAFNEEKERQKELDDEMMGADYSSEEEE